LSEDWDFYLCRVDDQPASIFVDLGIAEKAPLATYPVMAYVRLNMRDPREDGLSGRAEFDTLVAIEDQIVPQLTLGEDALFVGRNTSNGCRDFYFYRKSLDGWDERVVAAMAAFGDYRYEIGVRSDPEWRTYQEFLFPSDYSFQSIQNRRVCDALQREGDRLSDSREIDHWAYFPTEDGRSAFVAEAEKLGFALRTMIEGEREQDRYGAQVFRPDVPGHEAIDEITWPLYEAAKRLGGAYDGWEAFVLGGDRKNESVS
jgi:uncharacterized protein (TIGR01619 family)